MKNIITMLATIIGFAFAQEMEVDGNLKVTGTVDASGNPITNVGMPLLSTDAASAGYVITTTGGKGRIITIKCPWITGGEISDCEPPSCPDGWSSLITFNKITAAGVGGGANANSAGTNFSFKTAGNSVRYCMEQEEE